MIILWLVPSLTRVNSFWLRISFQSHYTCLLELLSHCILHSRGNSSWMDLNVQLDQYSVILIIPLKLKSLFEIKAPFVSYMGTSSDFGRFWSQPYTLMGLRSTVYLVLVVVNLFPKLAFECTPQRWRNSCNVAFLNHSRFMIYQLFFTHRLFQTSDWALIFHTLDQGRGSWTIFCDLASSVHPASMQCICSLESNKCSMLYWQSHFGYFAWKKQNASCWDVA